ncbi:glycosyltransferase family 15 protein [Conidiobolus coronatus NRRL 28638]|uniref:Glycosyltransferase family 15 protein n=1 Tax=Conidiobolus coronatus (strain ATCC 28846 / CBS 209.66 / NRRL 28638) TaxID=796925 RepID=A0A137NS07_CONC2|nr:glycosyltransferase family 15 protein [Conidiobolus coronatus NRRL 28638]|eukprot:KXN65527.1 glycosyltransferase family 15 protein [Conidiobolus coronatus NRRL 28638]
MSASKGRFSKKSITIGLLLFVIITCLYILKASTQVNITDSDISSNLYQKSSTTDPSTYKRANAAFVILVRNEELEEMVSSIQQLEKKFNKNYNYPYVFLNDKNFTQEFKDTIKKHTDAEVKFGFVPQEHWSIPSWIDQPKMREIWDKLDYPHGKSESYRHMCRFQSGFFYKHPLVRDLDYYWRVEPGINFPCKIKYDPFRFMEDNGKLYGFTIAIKEYMPTVETLMPTIDKWITENDLQHKIPDNAEIFIRNEFGEGYNGCHFWSNFEIASLSIWKSPSYEAFFNYLDKSGGFFYERWGDAPIHSIYLSLFLSIDKLHYFEEIGYRHSIFTHCPLGDMNWIGRCKCEQWDSVDLKSWCMIKYWKAKSPVSNRYLGEYLQHL